MDDVAISIKNLRKTYPAKTFGSKKTSAVDALKGIDLEIKKGEFFGLLGPNGAGKTTLINILTGVANKTSGSIHIFGKDIEKQSLDVKRHIGVSPQDYNFDVWLGVSKTLEYHAAYYGIPSAVRKKRADELLSRFGLKEKGNADTRVLSGGMKRKLILARALITDPDIIILDEPTAAVDVEVRHELWKYIQELNKSGKTIILTTHYLEEAERLCDRVAIINEGKIVAKGTPKDLMKQRKVKRLEDVFLHMTKEVKTT